MKKGILDCFHINARLPINGKIYFTLWGNFSLTLKYCESGSENERYLGKRTKLKVKAAEPGLISGSHGSFNGIVYMLRNKAFSSVVDEKRHFVLSYQCSNAHLRQN